MQRRSGFTLIELLVVMAALGLLLAIATPRYVEHVDRTREAVLRHNLKQVRDVIDRFRADRGRYPQTLQELVSTRYLRELPIDPMTDRTDSWTPVAPADGSGGGLVDIRSSAHGTASDGSPYATW